MTAAEMEEGHTRAPDEKKIRNISCLVTGYLDVAIILLNHFGMTPNKEYARNWLLRPNID